LGLDHPTALASADANANAAQAASVEAYVASIRLSKVKEVSFSD
jgi:hypothetical protein